MSDISESAIPVVGRGFRLQWEAAQERALQVLQFKLDVLWQMNDAMALAYGLSP